MFSRAIRYETKALLDALREAIPLLEILEAFAQTQQVVEQNLRLFASGESAKHQAAVNAIHGTFGAARAKLTGRSLRKVFQSSKVVVDALRMFGGRVGGAEVIRLIEEFDEHLDTFGTSHSIADGARILELAAHLQRRLYSLQGDLEDFLSRLEPTPILDGDDVALVELDGQYSLMDVATKLAALDEICRMVADLLGQFGVVANYRVRKIETGSLSIEIIAERVGIAALKRVLSGAVDFFYRNYTKEGQLRHGVRDAAAALKDAVKLRAALAKEGVNVEGIDEALSLQAERLVIRIGALSGLEGAVRINDVAHIRDTDTAPLALPPAPPRTNVQLGYEPGASTGDGS